MTSEIEVDVLNDRIPEKQGNRGKAENERWYCQLYAHRELPCAQVGEEKKPVNEAGIRHYSTDYDTVKSRYAQQVEVPKEATRKFTKGASSYVLKSSADGKSMINADVFHCIDANHTNMQCYKRLWSYAALMSFGSDEHVWELDMDEVEKATAAVIVEGQDIRGQHIKKFTDVETDQFEMVAVRGKLLGHRSGGPNDGKLVVQLPGGVDYFDSFDIIGVLDDFVPGEPLRNNTIISVSTGSKVWRFIRGGWLDVTTSKSTPIPWRKLWLMHKDHLQFWRNNDV